MSAAALIISVGIVLMILTFLVTISTMTMAPVLNTTTFFLNTTVVALNDTATTNAFNRVSNVMFFSLGAIVIMFILAYLALFYMNAQRREFVTGAI